MSEARCEVAVLGSGFAGTLVALIARRLGYEVALIERFAHPRFAIGESATPLADLMLARLAGEYGLGWLEPFSRYGSWKRTHPEIACGPKRGFSFFHHRAGAPFTVTATHENELLVAANPDEARADTHWFRESFDAMLVDRAVEAGVCYLDRCEITGIEHDRGWRVRGRTPDGEVSVRATFLVDGTGTAGVLARAMNIEDDTARMRTRSRAIYSHFSNVRLWGDLMETWQAGSCGEHPFPCDGAAMHHVFEGGWMWVLRFDHGVVSAGFSLHGESAERSAGETPEDEWRRLVDRLPGVKAQFADATPVRPIVSSGRLQRRLGRLAGTDWVLLPYAGGFVDPWLSTGIAVSLFGVDRLARVLAHGLDSEVKGALADYQACALREQALMDRITAGCFGCFDRFEVMCCLTMLYFAAAITCEERMRAGESLSEGFLLAGDPDFRRLAADACDRAEAVGPGAAGEFRDWLAKGLKPYNRVGLCDERAGHLYPFSPFQTI